MFSSVGICLARVEHDLPLLQLQLPLLQVQFERMARNAISVTFDGHFVEFTFEVVELFIQMCVSSFQIVDRDV